MATESLLVKDLRKAGFRPRGAVTTKNDCFSQKLKLGDKTFNYIWSMEAEMDCMNHNKMLDSIRAPAITKENIEEWQHYDELLKKCDLDELYIKHKVEYTDVYNFHSAWDNAVAEWKPNWEFRQGKGIYVGGYTHVAKKPISDDIKEIMKAKAKIYYGEQ